MNLTGNVASGDRVAAELLLAGGGDPVAGPAAATADARADAPPAFLSAALDAHHDGGPAAALAALDTVRPDSLRAGERVRLHCLASVWHRSRGDRERSAAALRRAEAEGRELDTATRAARHRALALHAGHAGDDALGDEHHRAALDLVPAGHPTLLGLLTSLYRARHAIDREQFTVALAEAEVAVRLCRMGGHRGLEPYALSVGADAKARVGRLDDALMDAVHAARLRETTGVRHDEAYGLLVLGAVHRRRRDLAQARTALEAAAKELPAEPGGGALEAAIHAELGRVIVADDPALAREHAQRAVAGADRTGRAAALLGRAWVALICGDGGTALADGEEARNIAAREGRPATGAEAMELLGLVTVDPRAGAALFEQARMGYRTVGDRPGEARVRTVAAAVRGATASRTAQSEEETLRHRGISLAPGVADALTVAARRTPLIAVLCLGGFRVLRGGSGIAPSEWQSKKARDLLKILVSARGRPVPRARLMELLWPGQSPAAGGSRLSVQLSTLRRVLDPDRRIQHANLIDADRSAVAVNLDLVHVDVERFLIAASDACAAHRHGDTAADELLTAAEALYVGEFMPDDPYTDWTQELRDEAQTAYVSVLRARVARSSDVDQRVSCLLRILRCDAYDEEAHLELVRSLRRAGRHGEARRRYRSYARCMHEIGVAPAPAQELAGQLTGF
ncbi:BTAD domain-containing putative transcriptional regulator [Kitasatospora sp. NPDC097643]|uniref:BTAD domain-containing putative transcriptional regulator n=1 Tax=Kitasatospora sp. NPDC097643 TaxID=3157230 RepID=UPI0033181B4A